MKKENQSQKLANLRRERGSLSQKVEALQHLISSDEFIQFDCRERKLIMAEYDCLNTLLTITKARIQLREMENGNND